MEKLMIIQYVFFLEMEWMKQELKYLQLTKGATVDSIEEVMRIKIQGIETKDNPDFIEVSI